VTDLVRFSARGSSRRHAAILASEVFSKGLTKRGDVEHLLGQQPIQAEGASGATSNWGQPQRLRDEKIAGLHPVDRLHVGLGAECSFAFNGDTAVVHMVLRWSL
jgi:hypothetical protein